MKNAGTQKRKAAMKDQSVLPVCNRQFLLRPNCQLQTGSTLR